MTSLSPARRRDRRPWAGLVLAAALAHTTVFVPMSHADQQDPAGRDEPPAGQATGQGSGEPAEAAGEPAEAAGQGAGEPAVQPAGQGAPDGAGGGARPARTFGLPQRVGWSWDVEIDLGLRLADRDIDAARGMARLQAGALWANEPYYFSFGATAELGGAAERAVGAQVTMTHLYAGTWTHLGASWLPRDSAVMSSLGAGWSLFGAEWQHRFDDGDALLLHVRLPLGTTWFLFTHRPVAPTR
jgi:hypothetical protein